MFTYAVESCKKFTKTNQIPFETSDTQVTVIANMNEMRSEILTCTAQIRDDAFCYPPNWYPSTAGADHAWIAGLVLGVVLPRKELEPVECEDPEDCVVDGDCYCGGYCAPTTGRCGQRSDGDLCATNLECINGLCIVRDESLFTGIVGVGYCSVANQGQSCTLGDNAACGVYQCGRRSNKDYDYNYESDSTEIEGWGCCNGRPETAAGTRCDDRMVGDPCTVDINCQKITTLRYCRNGACSDT